MKLENGKQIQMDLIWFLQEYFCWKKITGLQKYWFSILKPPRDVKETHMSTTQTPHSIWTHLICTPPWGKDPLWAWLS